MFDLLFNRSVVYIAGWNVRISNSRFLCGIWFLSALPYILRVYCHQLGIWGQQILRCSERYDWLLSDGMVEILLDYHDSTYLYC